MRRCYARERGFLMVPAFHPLLVAGASYVSIWRGVDRIVQSQIDEVAAAMRTYLSVPTIPAKARAPWASQRQ